MRALVILIVMSVAAFGQRHKAPEEVNAEKPEGKLMQQFMQEAEPAKKVALYEQFATEFPKDEHTPWVLEQVQAYYVKAGQPDQIIASGEKLLAVDPEDPEAALQALKAAETKKDLALVRKYSDLTNRNSRKMAAAPQPKEADEVEDWKKGVEYAKQVAQYSDYALFRAAVESRDPKLTIELAEALQQRSPESEYAGKIRDAQFLAYRQSGANDKAIAFAEKALATDQTNEDMLLVVADSYLQQKKEPEKVHAYSAKIVEIMSAKPKPEGTSDADWNSRKNTIVGLAHYMSGKLYSNEGKLAQADQELRKALPLIESQPALKPETLFMLGLANYKLAAGKPDRAQDAANFFRQCAAVSTGAMQTQAAKNLKSIQTEYRGIK
jgi:tetratricopeptide (TPR) repeat protein